MKKTFLAFTFFLISNAYSFAQVTCSGDECGVGEVNVAGLSGSGSSVNLSPIKRLIVGVHEITTLLAPTLIGIALLAFFWFLIKYLWKDVDNPTEREKSNKGMVWSIVALFVMTSIWGIIAVIGSITGVAPGGPIDGFTVPGNGQY